MVNIDVYKQYSSAECTYNGVARRDAVVWLNAESEDGIIRYEAGVSFFPHRDDENFGISYDACGTKELLRIQGRRSKKRDALYLEQLRAAAEEIAVSLGGVIHWDKPLRDAVYG